MRIYLDTSVPSTYFDDRTPDRQAVTRDFWDKALLHGHELQISEIVILEIAQNPNEEKRKKVLELVRDLPELKQGPEVIVLAKEIVDANLVPAGKIEDAIHLALSALHRVDVLVSWNFRHMVNLKMRQQLPLVLAKNGCFHKYEIISPYEYFEV
jgi:predicted nucleic acid-binding protein